MTAGTPDDTAAADVQTNAVRTRIDHLTRSFSQRPSKASGSDVSGTEVKRISRI